MLCTNYENGKMRPCLQGYSFPGIMRGGKEMDRRYEFNYDIL
jgi:hypothetical protein